MLSDEKQYSNIDLDQSSNELNESEGWLFPASYLFQRFLHPINRVPLSKKSTRGHLSDKICTFFSVSNFVF